MMEPDWSHFRAFLAVLRDGTLSGAARELGLTQPTLGRQIAELERIAAITPVILFGGFTTVAVGIGSSASIGGVITPR